MLPSLPGVMAGAWKENTTHAPKLVLPVGADMRGCLRVCVRSPSLTGGISMWEWVLRVPLCRPQS